MIKKFTIAFFLMNFGVFSIYADLNQSEGIQKPEPSLSVLIAEAFLKGRLAIINNNPSSYEKESVAEKVFGKGSTGHASVLDVSMQAHKEAVGGDGVL